MSNKEIVKAMKGFVVYDATEKLDLTKIVQDEHFDFRKYKISGEDELSTIGFLPTVELEVNEDGEIVREEEYVSTVSGLQVVKIGSSKRKVPANEVKKMVNAQIKAFIKAEKERGEENVKIDKDLKDMFKEEAIKELLPKCFVDEYQTYAFYDTNSNRFFVFENSAKKAEKVNSLIRASLGSFPVIPLSVGDVDVGKKFAEFITVPLNDVLTLEDFAEIENEEGVVTFKKESLYDAEVAGEVLKQSSEAFVSKIGLNYDGTLSFVVNNELIFSGLKFESYLTASGHDFKSTFLLSASEVVRAVKELIKELTPEDDE